LHLLRSGTRTFARPSTRGAALMALPGPPPRLVWVGAADVYAAATFPSLRSGALHIIVRTPSCEGNANFMGTWPSLTEFGLRLEGGGQPICGVNIARYVMRLNAPDGHARGRRIYESAKLARAEPRAYGC
jgi:hypothetical protein